MFDYLKTTVGKTVSDALISLAGYVGGYSLVNPSDKHGIKSSKLLCKGKVICIPFYHSGHDCQVYLNFDRTNFEEVAYGVLFPDGKIIDISTGCPGLGEPTIKPEVFGPNCQLIFSKTMHKFPEHIDMLNTEDYFYFGTDDISEDEDTVVQESSDEVEENILEHFQQHETFSEHLAHDVVEELKNNTEIIDTLIDEISDKFAEKLMENINHQLHVENNLTTLDSYEYRSKDVLHEEDENSPAAFDYHSHHYL